MQYYTDVYKYQVVTLYLFEVFVSLGFFSPESYVFTLRRVLERNAALYARTDSGWFIIV